MDPINIGNVSSGKAPSNDNNKILTSKDSLENQAAINYEMERVRLICSCIFIFIYLISCTLLFQFIQEGMAEVTVHTSNDQFCNDAAVRIF
jgi:hypothetical protein